MQRRSPRHGRAVGALAVVATVLLAACTSKASGPEPIPPGCDGTIRPGTIEIWWTSVDPATDAAVAQLGEDFNAAQVEADSGIEAVITLVLPEDLERDLDATTEDRRPDLVVSELPALFSNAFEGQLQPFDNCLPPDLVDDLYPSAIEIGRFRDATWGLPVLDRDVVLFASAGDLAEIEARIPSGADDPWTVEEFDTILRDLQDANDGSPPLALPGTATNAELAAAFSPVVWSAGGDLINRDRFDSASETLDTEAVAEALSQFQTWIDDGLLLAGGDGFAPDGSALSWAPVDHFGDYREQFGEDLVALPLPDFGNGSFGSSSPLMISMVSGNDGDAAWRFISSTLGPADQAALVEASGSVPVRRLATAEVGTFAEGGALHLLILQRLEGTTFYGPRHPVAAATVTGLGEAVRAVLAGDDVDRALNGAVGRINGDLAAHNGYPEPTDGS